MTKPLANTDGALLIDSTGTYIVAGTRRLHSPSSRSRLVA
jgi:hypothetical protein